MANQDQNNRGREGPRRPRPYQPIPICQCNHCRYLRGEPFGPQVRYPQAQRPQEPRHQAPAGQRFCDCWHCRNLRRVI